MPSIHDVLSNDQDILRQLTEIVKELFQSWHLSFMLYKYNVHTEQPPNGYEIAVICVETSIVSTAYKVFR